MDEKGELSCPRGTFVGTYFSEELKCAVSYGYKVKVLSAVQFDRGTGLFDSFIKDMFRRKHDAKRAKDSVGELSYKLIQNSLFGKSGQREIVHSFKFIDSKKLSDFELKNKMDLSQVFGNKTLVRTQGKIDNDLLQIITAGQKESCDSAIPDLKLPPRKMNGVKSSVSIASAITGYARIAMNRFKNIPGNRYLGGDTDSAILEFPLDPKYVGEGLGMMKLEYEIDLGLLADKKLYYVKDTEGMFHIKSRGVGKSLSGKDILGYEDFIKLFRGETVNVQKTKFFIKEDGVYIKPQTISVKIKESGRLEIQNELMEILKDPLNPSYSLAKEISEGRSETIAPVRPDDFLRPPVARVNSEPSLAGSQHQTPPVNKEGKSEVFGDKEIEPNDNCKMLKPPPVDKPITDVKMKKPPPNKGGLL